MTPRLLSSFLSLSTRGVPPANTVCSHTRSMFCPLTITAARPPRSRWRSLINPASAAAPAPSAQLCVEDNADRLRDFVIRYLDDPIGAALNDL